MRDDLKREIKKEIGKASPDQVIDFCLDKAIICSGGAMGYLIRKEFDQRIKKGEKQTDIIDDISIRNNVSTSTVYFKIFPERSNC